MQQISLSPGWTTATVYLTAVPAVPYSACRQIEKKEKKKKIAASQLIHQAKRNNNKT